MAAMIVFTPKCPSEGDISRLERTVDLLVSPGVPCSVDRLEMSKYCTRSKKLSYYRSKVQNTAIYTNNFLT